MNIWKVHWTLRDFGVNYGLPVLTIEVGPGISYSPEDLLSKLVKEGLTKESWVLFRGNPVRERGCGVVVEGLKSVNVKVEIEEDGDATTPGWFLKSDRWIVFWEEKGTFNYGGLRTRQDMLVLKDESKLEIFLATTKGMGMFKAVLTKEPEKLLEKIKGKEIRIYRLTA